MYRNVHVGNILQYIYYTGEGLPKHDTKLRSHKEKDLSTDTQKTCVPKTNIKLQEKMQTERNLLQYL